MGHSLRAGTTSTRNKMSAGASGNPWAEFADERVQRFGARHSRTRILPGSPLVAYEKHGEVDFRGKPRLAMPKAIVSRAGNDAARVRGTGPAGPIPVQQNPSGFVEH